MLARTGVVAAAATNIWTNHAIDFVAAFFGLRGMKILDRNKENVISISSLVAANFLANASRPSSAAAAAEKRRYSIEVAGTSIASMLHLQVWQSVLLAAAVPAASVAAAEANVSGIKLLRRPLFAKQAPETGRRKRRKESILRLLLLCHCSLSPSISLFRSDDARPRRHCRLMTASNRYRRRYQYHASHYNKISTLEQRRNVRAAWPIFLF